MWQIEAVQTRKWEGSVKVKKVKGGKAGAWMWMDMDGVDTDDWHTHTHADTHAHTRTRTQRAHTYPRARTEQKECQERVENNDRRTVNISSGHSFHMVASTIFCGSPQRCSRELSASRA